VLESRPEVGVLYGQISISGETVSEAWPDSAPSGNVFEALLTLTDDFMSPDTVLVRREAFQQAGGFDENLPTMEHYDMYLRLAYYVQFLFIPGPVAHGRYSTRGKWHTNVKNRNNERVLPFIVERALAMLPDAESSEAVRRKGRVAVFSTIAGQRWETEDVREVRDYVLRTLDKYPWMISQPDCVKHLYMVAGQIARESAAPLSAVRTFLEEVRAAVAVPDFAQQWKRRRSLASIWRGAAASLWSAHSYSRGAYAAIRAILCDPIYLRRLVERSR
jgi:hypothetical protein